MPGRRRIRSGECGFRRLEFLISEYRRSGFPPGVRSALLHPSPNATFAERLRAGGGPLTTSDRDVVAALGLALAHRIGEPRYNLWFQNKTKLTFQDGTIVVGVPNHFYQDWVQKTFADSVRAAAADVFGLAPQVQFVIDPELFQASRRAQEEIQPPNPERDTAKPIAAKAESGPPRSRSIREEKSAS